MFDKQYIKENEELLRNSIVEEAYECLKTPYHVLGQVKGVGLDCMTLLIQVYSRVNLVNWFKAPHYSPDFYKHKSTEDYLNGLSMYGKPSIEYKKGNILLYKMGRVIGHSAIIVDYPTIIHSVTGKGCILDNAHQKFLKKRENCIFSFWRDK